MGEPIELEQNENPSQEEIDRVHALLVTRMIELFDEHKASYGWADKKLIVT
jgi:hypothetical protein